MAIDLEHFRYNNSRATAPYAEERERSDKCCGVSFQVRLTYVLVFRH